MGCTNLFWTVPTLPKWCSLLYYRLTDMFVELADSKIME